MFIPKANQSLLCQCLYSNKILKGRDTGVLSPFYNDSCELILVILLYWRPWRWRSWRTPALVSVLALSCEQSIMRKKLWIMIVQHMFGIKKSFSWQLTEFISFHICLLHVWSPGLHRWTCLWKSSIPTSLFSSALDWAESELLQIANSLPPIGELWLLNCVFLSLNQNLSSQVTNCFCLPSNVLVWTKNSVS